MSFVQIIEFRTDKAEELDHLMDEWVEATSGRRSATRATLTVDHEHPGNYCEIVEFPSYEEAMANSKLPETDAIAQRMRAICDGEPTFHNLDVVREQAL
jgi:hypothetical protein